MIVLEKFDTKTQLREFKALRYAETFGVIAYKVNRKFMVYYQEFMNEGKFKHMINLDTMEHESKKVKKAYWELKR